MNDFLSLAGLMEKQVDAWEVFRKMQDERTAAIERDIDTLGRAMQVQQLATQRTGGASVLGCMDDRSREFMSYLRKGIESKSMSINSDPDGGYLVPERFDTLLTKTVSEVSPLRRLARVVQTDSAEFSMMHSNTRSSTAWAGETAPRGETSGPQFMKMSIRPYDCYAQPYISQQLLDDNAFDLQNWLLEDLSQAFGAAEAAAFISGDGVTKPAGILLPTTAATADGTRADTSVEHVATGVSGDWAASNKGDKLIDLVHKLSPQYRQGASWLMNTSTLASIRQFKTATTLDYLVRDGLNAGQPSTLLGYPVYECADMPAIAAGSYSVAFGNWQRAYTIVDRKTMMLRDPYSQKPFVCFYTVKRVGGAPRDLRAYKLLKFAAS